MDTTHTDMGTPCSPRWDDEWIAAVNAAETKAERRICGARTCANTPCTLEPNHDNGRCRFHGGFDLTGAQPGNRNAVIHGLYSRTLQHCAPHCAVWKTCPLSGEDVCKLPQSEVPTCPYETTLYQVAVSDALARLDTHAATDPMHRHLAQQTALLSVMMQRAAIAMGEHHIADSTVVTGEKYQMNTKKESPYLQAYLRLSSEYRRFLKLIEADDVRRPTDKEIQRQDQRNQVDTSLTPEDQAQLDTAQPVAPTRVTGPMHAAEGGSMHAAEDDPDRGNKRGARGRPKDARQDAGTPVNNSLAAAMQPLLEKTEGVLEEALEIGRKKRAESASKNQESRVRGCASRTETHREP